MEDVILGRHHVRQRPERRIRLRSLDRDDRQVGRRLGALPKDGKARVAVLEGVGGAQVDAVRRLPPPRLRCGVGRLPLQAEVVDVREWAHAVSRREGLLLGARDREDLPVNVDVAVRADASAHPCEAVPLVDDRLRVVVVLLASQRLEEAKRRTPNALVVATPHIAAPVVRTPTATGTAAAAAAATTTTSATSSATSRSNAAGRGRRLDVEELVGGGDLEPIKVLEHVLARDAQLGRRERHRLGARLERCGADAVRPPRAPHPRAAVGLSWEVAAPPREQGCEGRRVLLVRRHAAGDGVGDRGDRTRDAERRRVPVRGVVAGQRRRRKRQVHHQRRQQLERRRHEARVIEWLVARGHRPAARAIGVGGRQRQRQPPQEDI